MAGKQSIEVEMLTRKQLTDIARELVNANGKQVRVAQTLGVTQAAVSKALKEGEVGMDGLRIRILEELGGYTIDREPHYRAQLPAKGRARA